MIKFADEKDGGVTNTLESSNLEKLGRTMSKYIKTNSNMGKYIVNVLHSITFEQVKSKA